MTRGTRDLRIAVSAFSAGSIGLPPLWHLVTSFPSENKEQRGRRRARDLPIGEATARGGLLASLAQWLDPALHLFR